MATLTLPHTERYIMNERQKAEKMGLMTFLKGSPNPNDNTPGCANVDEHYGGCVQSGKCLVREKRRCDYFEKSVLPTASHYGQLKRMTTLYNKHVGIKGWVADEINRKCECGSPLEPRQRVCPDCKRKKAIQSRRDYRAKIKASEKSHAGELS